MSNAFSLYQVYLVADMIQKAITKSGGRHTSIDLDMRTGSPEEKLQFMAFWDANVCTHVHEDSATPEGREELVAKLLEAIPRAQLKRKDGKMTIYGKATNGVSFYLWMGEGVCERVQVGTRTVMKPDPTIDVPMVEVEEPIFEVRCIDPINEMMGAQA